MLFLSLAFSRQRLFEFIRCHWSVALGNAQRGLSRLLFFSFSPFFNFRILPIIYLFRAWWKLVFFLLDVCFFFSFFFLASGGGLNALYQEGIKANICGIIDGEMSSHTGRARSGGDVTSMRAPGPTGRNASAAAAAALWRARRACGPDANLDKRARGRHLALHGGLRGEEGKRLRAPSSRPNSISPPRTIRYIHPGPGEGAGGRDGICFQEVGSRARVHKAARGGMPTFPRLLYLSKKKSKRSFWEFFIKLLMLSIIVLCSRGYDFVL